MRRKHMGSDRKLPLMDRDMSRNPNHRESVTWEGKGRKLSIASSVMT